MDVFQFLHTHIWPASLFVKLSTSIFTTDITNASTSAFISVSASVFTSGSIKAKLNNPGHITSKRLILRLFFQKCAEKRERARETLKTRPQTFYTHFRRSWLKVYIIIMRWINEEKAGERRSSQKKFSLWDFLTFF